MSDAYTVDAVAHLYSYVHAVPEATVREAARLRVEAMRLSVAWIAAGCSLTDPNLVVERRTLIASYAALRPAVDEPGMSANRRAS